MTLAEESRRAAALLTDHEYVRLVARAGDGDALCAASVLAFALRREGVDFHFSAIPFLSQEAIERLASERNDAVVLVGLAGDAGGDLTALPGALVLVDHHLHHDRQ